MGHDIHLLEGKVTISMARWLTSLQYFERQAADSGAGPYNSTNEHPMEYLFASYTVSLTFYILHLMRRCFLLLSIENCYQVYILDRRDFLVGRYLEHRRLHPDRGKHGLRFFFVRANDGVASKVHISECVPLRIWNCTVCTTVCS